MLQLLDARQGVAWVVPAVRDLETLQAVALTLSWGEWGAAPAEPEPALAPRKRGWFGLGPAREAPRQVLLATPSDQFLPPYAAKALHKYLTEAWGLPNPRVLLMTDMALRPHRQLVIGKKRSEFPDEQAAWQAMQYVLWHLPPMRSAVLLPEDWRLDDLTPLRDLFAGAPGL